MKATLDQTSTPRAPSAPQESAAPSDTAYPARTSATPPPSDPTETLFSAIARDELDLLANLLDQGNDPDFQRADGWAPLHLAAYLGKWGAAELLLESGAWVDLPQEDDFTPLHLAAWRGNHEIALLLARSGADLDAHEYRGRTPLQLATSRGERQTASLLRQAAEEQRRATRTAPPAYDLLLGSAAPTPQYGLLGIGEPTSATSDSRPTRLALDLNGTQTISLFGVQGSGKSYTLGTLIEMALRPAEGINELPAPLGAVLFHSALPRNTGRSSPR